MSCEPNYYGRFQPIVTQTRDDAYPCKDDRDEPEPVIHSDCCDVLMTGDNLKNGSCPKCQCDCSLIEQPSLLVN